MRARKIRTLISPSRRGGLMYSLLVFICAAVLNAQVRIGWDRDNAPEQQNKPYVVLVGLDGFRHDYAEEYHATRLQALGRNGVHTTLIPAFPSLTFPNFYSIATGLYPQNHGIVDNAFYDTLKQRRFDFTNRDDASDGNWYGGIPIWALAQRQGMRAATFFWVGSDVEIGGQRPSYYVPFDANIPSETKVAQVISWLRLPPAKRPHLVAVYFNDADHAGHRFGPDSNEVREAVQRLDHVVGELEDQINQLRLPVNLLVVSDHGMILQKRDAIIVQDYLGAADLPAPAKRASPINLHADSPQQAERWYAALYDKDPRFEVYRRADVPKQLHYSSSPRIGDLVIVLKEPVQISIPAIPAAVAAKYFEGQPANHGYDPRFVPEMNGILYGRGPNIKAGARIGPVENVEIYPLITRILGLEIDGKIDGSRQLAKEIYRR